MKILFLIIITFNILSAQSVRKLVNEGVDLYKDKKFTDAEVNFKKSLEKEPQNFTSKFNLGDAYFKQERYDEAISTFKEVMSQTDDKNLQAKIWYNIGNSLLKSQKIKGSIEAYKNSLKLNPNDAEAKYNLSYALKMLNDENQQNQNDKNDKNENKENEQNKNENQNNQNQDQQQNEQNQNNESQNDKQNQEQQQNQQQHQQREGQISKEDAERILNALRDNEKKVQEKLRKQTGTPKKTEKDW